MSIVLGYDESPGARRALVLAIDLAAQYGEPLVLVHGVSPPGGVGEEFQAHQQALVELGSTAIKHAVEQATEAGVDTEVELVHAKPAQALVEVADRLQARMIVVGTWGESPLRGAMLGSTPHRLLQLAAQPVLVVPE